MSIRVLIVDDSALIREVLTSMLAKDGDIEVVGSAEDPIIAREKIKQLNPDVVTLDIEMPNMNGLEFLSKLMRLHPLPVVMVSTLTTRGASETMLALELGAVDFAAKPGADLSGGVDRFGSVLREKVRAAAQSDVRGRAMRVKAPQVPIKTAAGAVEGSLIALGASTGGVEAIQQVLSRLPADSPPILIAQHMPAHFTARFAQRLNELYPLKVQEAQDRQPLRRGEVYIAPGGLHLSIERSSGQLKCRITENEAVNGHRPSVDFLFRSVGRVAGAKAVGALLTGMGRDGAEGLKVMHDAGAFTVGQSKESALVYGMPRAAAEIGAVSEEARVEDIAGKLVNALLRRPASAA